MMDGVTKTQCQILSSTSGGYHSSKTNFIVLIKEDIQMRKKIVALVLILTMSAANTMALVIFDAVNNGDGTVTISYTTDGHQPSAIALRILCSDTLLITGGSGTDAAFNCFPDYAYSNDPYVLGDGDPFADPAGPGAATLPVAEVSICMGVLDETGNQAAGPTTATIIVLATTGSGDMTIAADTLRGPGSGVVSTEGELESNLSGGGTIWPRWPIPDCMAETNPDYDTWISVGMPDCWCCEYQCRGDADCLIQFGILRIYSDDLDCLVGGYGQPILPPGGICCDFDHKMQFGVLRIYTDDLAVLVANYGKSTVVPCSGPGSGNDEDPLPNSEFNFWVVP
jgi:hypothetical protein